MLPAQIPSRIFATEPPQLTSGDQRFGEVIEYLEEISADQGLAVNFTVQGDEVIIHQ